MTFSCSVPRRNNAARSICCLVLISAGALSGAAQAAEASYTATKYPIVMVPGAFGFGYAMGVFDYWFNITEALQRGGAKVYLAKISPLNSNEARGEQLVQQIQEVLALTGAGKVNLIGHSQGGATARYAAAVLPGAVASVTTVAAPHLGSSLADFLVKHPAEGSIWRTLLISFCTRLADLIGWVSADGNPNVAVAGLGSLTTEGAARFNALFPAGLPVLPCGEGEASREGQLFYSWTGIGQDTNLMDVSDPVLRRFGKLFGDANDGMVGRCSAHFGQVIRDNYRQNHLDNVNQAIGMVALSDANPVELYRMHANRLKRAGL